MATSAETVAVTEVAAMAVGSLVAVATGEVTVGGEVGEVVRATEAGRVAVVMVGVKVEEKEGAPAAVVRVLADLDWVEAALAVALAAARSVVGQEAEETGVVETAAEVPEVDAVVPMGVG